MALREGTIDSEDGAITRGQHVEVLAAGAAKTLVARDSGALVLLDTAAGSIVTLPATPVAGMVFDFAVSVSVTSNSHIVKTGNAVIFIGGAIQQMIDTTAVSEGQFADPTSDVTCTMNGTTTGGLLGTHLRFVALSATVWHCTGLVASSGTLATPFA